MKNTFSSAQLYHGHHSQAVEDLPFWLKWAQAQNYLAQAGHTIFGIDHDANMLFILQSQLTNTLHQQVHLVQADFTAFHLQKAFGVILLACNTLSTLTPNAQRKALICVRQHLSKDGIFVVSVPNPTLLAGLPSKGESILEESFPHPESGEPVQVSSDWACAAQTVTFYWHYDHLLADGRVERSTVSSKHYRQSLQEIKRNFVQTGLTIIAMYGDYGQCPYQEESAYLIILARAK
jgi:SAM-dependent methyltransferase